MDRFYRMKLAALWLAALVLAGTGQAQAAPPMQGVWRGTIGTLPVMVCLMTEQEHFPRGSYYYLSRKQPIPLAHGAGDGQWTEQPVGGEEADWRISPADPARITGTWRQGGKTLPIMLDAVAATDREWHPCASRAFIAPRLAATRIVSSPARKNGVVYTVLKLEVGRTFADVEIASVQFPVSRPGDRAINQALRALIAPTSERADYVWCMSAQLASTGTDGYFYFAADLQFITRDWLSVALVEGGGCGGAHPYSGTSYRTFDRRSGREADLARWLSPRGFIVKPVDKDGWIERAITPQLRRLIVAKLRPGEAECRETLDQADHWEIALTARGLAFEPDLPHVSQACGDRAELSFAELRPFLSAEGRAGGSGVH